MRKIALTCVSLGLAGCMSLFWEPMEKGLAALQGQHIREAINGLGLPSSERNVAGLRLIVWSTQSTGVLPNSTTSTTYGNFGAVPYGQTTYSSGVSLVDYECEIVLQIDEDGVIQTTQYHGNLGGCEAYMNRLRSLTR